MKFSINPPPGETGFSQWKESIRAVARLPEGIPKQFRKNVIYLILNKHQIYYYLFFLRFG
jgi:hypothetical protein